MPSMFKQYYGSNQFDRNESLRIFAYTNKISNDLVIALILCVCVCRCSGKYKLNTNSKIQQPKQTEQKKTLKKKQQQQQQAQRCIALKEKQLIYKKRKTTREREIEREREKRRRVLSLLYLILLYEQSYRKNHSNNHIMDANNKGNMKTENVHKMQAMCMLTAIFRLQCKMRTNQTADNNTKHRQ